MRNGAEQSDFMNDENRIILAVPEQSILKIKDEL